MVKSKERWIWFLIITVASSALFFAKPIVWQSGASDSAIYSATIDFFKGDSADFNRYAQETPGFGARPLWPASAWPLSYYFSNFTALSIINILFSLATVILLYNLVKHLYDEKTAWLSGLLYAMSLVPIAYASRPLAEAGSYFFLVLLIAYVEIYATRYLFMELAWLFLLFALALLHKESALFLLLYVAIDGLYRFGFWKAAKKGLGVFVSFVSALIPVTLWKFWTGTSWFRVRGNQLNRETLTWAGIPSLIFRSFITFHLGWIFAIYGFVKDKDKQRKTYYTKCLLAIVPIVLYAWFFAPPFSPRFAHLLFPLVIPLFAFGLQRFVKDCKLSSNWIWGIVVVYYLISYGGASLFPSGDVNKDTNLVQLVLSELRSRM